MSEPTAVPSRSRRAQSSTPEPTWSAKEVYADFKADLNRRFDRQDETLERIDRRIDETAKKEDLVEVHARIDGVERRIEPLEQMAADERAIEVHRGKVRTNLSWLAGVLGSMALVASVILVVWH